MPWRIAQNFRLWRREVRPTLALALPIMAGMVSQMLMGLADTIMVGHVGVVPLAAASFVNAVAHLPLVVPDNCSYRVGYDWRKWQEGKCWVFDDTIEHEARNDSAQLRVILMFDVWNPLLSLTERDMVGALASAMREYRAASDT